MQNTEETIAKYAVDANLFRLGSANPKNKIQGKKLKKNYIQNLFNI